uniref:Transmembrane protein 98 n=1 Tax=Steinernema glaseri TaxID=37863 RepID=A0A1I7Y7K2_9BILA
MDPIALLALVSLGITFLFTAVVLFVVLYGRFKFSEPVKFSNLKNQESIDDVMQLKPLIAQTLANDEWTYDASGMVEHCVDILKLCQSLIDALSSIPTQKLEMPMNFAICQAASRIVPLFDDLAASIAETPLDVRLMEARATACVTGCWALALPFSLLNQKYRDQFDGVLRQMEKHVFALKDAVLQAETAAQAAVPAITVVDEEPPQPVVPQKAPEEEAPRASPTSADECPADPAAPHA